MCTRGLVGFQNDGLIKATYNHLDSYPEYLGYEVVNFMSGLSANGIEKLKQNVKKLRWVDEESKPTPLDRKTYAHFAAYTGRITNIDWYELLRTTQGGRALSLIFSDALDVMIDNTSFLNSPFDCEWSYIINFDENTLDVYKGDRKRVAKRCLMVFRSPLNFYATAEKWLIDLTTTIKNMRKNVNKGSLHIVK